MTDTNDERLEQLPTGKVSDTLCTLQIDGFDLEHPVTGMRVRRSLMVDEGSPKTVVARRQ